MDWTGCEWVECVPERLSGVPVVVGSRVQAEAVLENFDEETGSAEIADMFELQEEKVRGVLEFCRSSATCHGLVHAERMRVIFDQNVPRKLRLSLRSHLVMTALQLGWDQIANGSLIRMAEDAGFEVLVTADKGIYYQQNNQERKIALVVLTRQREVDVLRHVSQVQAAIDGAEPGSYCLVEISKAPR